MSGSGPRPPMPVPLDYASPADDDAPPPPSAAGCVGGCVGAIVGGLFVPVGLFAAMITFVPDPEYPAIFFLLVPVGGIFGCAAGVVIGVVAGFVRERRGG